MFMHAYVDVYVLCVCVVGHGCDYTTKFKESSLLYYLLKAGGRIAEDISVM